MRRGCIAISEIKCNECKNTIPHGQRYLAIEDEDKTTARLCLECCKRHGYAGYRRERGQEFLTLFMPDFESQPGPAEPSQ